jgi:hypothetical protein
MTRCFCRDFELLWFLFVVAGYAEFVFPGIALHLSCVCSAASGDPLPMKPIGVKEAAALFVLLLTWAVVASIMYRADLF